MNNNYYSYYIHEQSKCEEWLPTILVYHFTGCICLKYVYLALRPPLFVIPEYVFAMHTQNL